MVATVVAFNIHQSRPNGGRPIGKTWSEEGLEWPEERPLEAPSVKCGVPGHCAFPGVCKTVWLEVENTNCSSSFSINITKLQQQVDESVSVRFDMRVANLTEGEYPFVLHFPTNNQTIWNYVPMEGKYVLRAVADAAMSQVRLCQNAACPPAQFISANGGMPPIVVTIDAKDVDGFAIQRDGEALTITVRQPDGSDLLVQARFDLQSKVYEAAFPGLVQNGSHRVFLMTPLAPTPYEVANLTLQCAPGYAPNPVQCRPRQQVCTAYQYKDDADGTCKLHPTMAVAAVSTILRLHLKKSCGAQHREAVRRDASGYSLQPLQLRLQSGDINNASSIHWNASSADSWIRLERTAGSVSSLTAAVDLPFSVDLRGLNDTAGRPLKSTIFVHSKSGNNAIRFLNGSEMLEIPVELEIEAEACINTSIITLKAVAAAQTISSGSDVVVGDSVHVLVSSFDSERLPIERPSQQIHVAYRAAGLDQSASSSRSVVMKWTGQNQLVGDIDTSALVEGQYTLVVVDGENAETHIVFKVVERSKTTLIFGATVGSLLAGLLAIGIFVLYKHRQRAKQLLLSLLSEELRMFLGLCSEVWDLVGPPSKAPTKQRKGGPERVAPKTEKQNQIELIESSYLTTML